MSTLGSSLDLVKVIKQQDIITVIESYSTQQYTGNGYVPSAKATLSVSTNIVVHNKANLQIAVKDNTISIRSVAGGMHTFSFDVLNTEGVTMDSPLHFAQALMA